MGLGKTGVLRRDIWQARGRGLLMGVKIPHNKGRHCLFRKSQLDSLTFGVASSMGLWTHYHSKCLVLVALKLKELKVSQLSNLI